MSSLSLVLALGLLVLSSRLPAQAIEEEAFPGWKGERASAGGKGAAHEAHEASLLAAMVGEVDTNLRDDSVLKQHRDTGIDPFQVTQVAKEPRAFVYSGFLTPEECDHLISLARPKIERSFVTDNDSGKSVESNIRTSSGMFLNKYQDPVVERVERRIADWTFLPVENGESIQVLRYEGGQKYDAHYDYFHDKINSQMGGHRYATVLMYLSDVEEGGETVFPSSQVAPGSATTEKFSPCGQRGVAVKPRKGDALLFYSLHLDGTTDEHSLHAGCPVVRGEKWSATKWIHVGSFEARPEEPSSCSDLNPSCIEWAAMGECTKNPAYMVGEKGRGGHCRKACKKC